MSENVAKDPPPVLPQHATGEAHGHSSGNFWILALGSIGVVFGDIGTSPLYALQTALGQFKDSGLGASEVIGVVSLIIWALLIIVTAKYVVFLMQADNKGEGGILSLMALAQRALGQTHDDRLSARRGRVRAVFRRRDHHPGDLGSLRARGAEAGRRRSRALRPAGDGCHSRAAVHRAEPRHRRRRRFFGPIMVVFFLVNAVLGLAHIAARLADPAGAEPAPGVGFMTPMAPWVSSCSAAFSSR